MNLKEREIDIKLEYFIIPNPKEKRPKIVPLIDDDIEILKKMSKGLPELFYYRYVNGISGIKGGQRFGNKYLYKWWKKAISNLGFFNVDLYGGTRHSSVTDLRKMFTPEEIRNFGTLHRTNKAFNRYIQFKINDSKKIYEYASKSTLENSKKKGI